MQTLNESRIRREAAIHGLRLVKSRRSGNFALLEDNLVVFGGNGAVDYSASLEECQSYLAR